MAVDEIPRTVWTAGRRRAVIILLLALAGSIAPLLAPYDSDVVEPGLMLQAPTWRHPFGSDDFGRDVLSRLMIACQSSLLVATASVAVALPLGAIAGVVSGYFGRAVDAALMRPIEMLLAIPAMLLALTLISILGQGAWVTVLAIGVCYLPVLARTARSSTLVVSRELYVEAARVRGAGHVSVMYRHVLPNAIGPCLAQASVLAGIAVQIEAALSFLGLGVQPPAPSLGGMLAEGRSFLSEAPWICVFPGIALAAITLAFTLLGDTARRNVEIGRRA